jgi:ectoine hydroxylase-related dioxygenase (phytanoyl-CoA dioxygenase family)
MSMVEDLSTRHGPVSDLFEVPRTPGDWDKYRLSRDQVEFYRQNGYLSGVRLLSDEQVDLLRRELETLVDPQRPGHELFYEFHSNESTDPNTVLFHALGAWRITPGFHDILWNPAFLMADSQLLDGPIRFWHDQLFCKPARHGGVVAWHQDYSYWTRTQPMAHLTCWIALDDAHRRNGCVCYVPGSHRWPLLPITGLAGGMDAIQTVLTDQQKQSFEVVYAEMPKGCATFHHPLMVHGSYENCTDGPRRAVVLNVFRDGVKSDSNDSLLTGVPPIPAGQPMSGQFFPHLFPKNS